ncbi:MAG TPA: hypothetical protein VK996_16245 [Ramlibacter sp.]|nr:hypothetical protein [Ramlibacter sp.]
MSTKPTPDVKQPKPASQPQADDEPGTNAVEHEPDPAAKPIPDGEHKYIKRSPYTAGND